MPSTKKQLNINSQTSTPQEKQQTILFFKSYMRYLKLMITNKNSLLKEQNGSIFDLKKISGNVSLELFLQRVLSYFKCGIQAYICALCFIDRLINSMDAKTEKLVISIKNIFKILSVALLISTKNFDDFYYSNTYYARVCGLTLQQLNTLQKQYLKMIDFDVFVDSDEYKVYETILTQHKNKIIDEMIEARQKENKLNEENRSLIQKRNKFNLSESCQNSQQQDQTNIQVEVSA